MDQIVLDFLKLIHRKEINKRTYFTFGYQAEYKQNENIDLGYIPFILCNRFTNQVEIISKLNPNNRCGIERSSTEFITVHDTASAAPTANALAHSNWLNSMANDINSKTSVSWHFTVDENGIIQHLPDNEIGYHAGDGTKVKLTYEDTKIKVTTENPNVTISNDGYFEINSIKTNILAPKNNPF